MSDSTKGKPSQSSNSSSSNIDVVIPHQGLLYSRDTPDYLLCKPKLMPLKSVTLEKLEKMQKDAEMKLNEMQNTGSEH